MEFEEFIEVFGTNWCEDEKKWAELIWYQDLLLGFYEAKFAAGVISIYIEKIVSKDFFQKYVKARAMRLGWPPSTVYWSIRDTSCR